jgi:hypothetical protein
VYLQDLPFEVTSEVNTSRDTKMLAMIAKRRSKAQGPPPPPPAPLVNLQKAITHMPEATPQEVDENLSGWYQALQADTGPVDTAEAYATLCSELCSKGNPSGKLRGCHSH